MNFIMSQHTRVLPARNTKPDRYAMGARHLQLHGPADLRSDTTESISRTVSYF